MRGARPHAPNPGEPSAAREDVVADRAGEFLARTCVGEPAVENDDRPVADVEVELAHASLERGIVSLAFDLRSLLTEEHLWLDAEPVVDLDSKETPSYKSRLVVERDIPRFGVVVRGGSSLRSS